MHPVIYRLGPITLYSYGFMVAAGFIIATLLASRQASRFNIPQDRVTTLSLVVLISGILGARVLYVLLNLREYIANPLEIFMITHGGLAFFGGIAAAFLAGLIYARRARLSVYDIADLLAPYIALGHSMGRIGCLLNGCCFGRPSGGTFGIMFRDGVIRVPTQLYSSLYLLFLYMLLRVFLQFRQFKGQVFFLYLMFYSAWRVAIENFRDDNMPVIFGVTFSQIVSAALFILGAVFYLYRMKNER